MNWEEIKLKGKTPPSGSDGHKMTYFPKHNLLVVFGVSGTSNPRNNESSNFSENASNDIYFLNSKTYEWTKPQVKGVLPPKRKNVNIAKYKDDYLLVFGGVIGPRKYGNDLWIFDLVNLVWKEIKYTGQKPSSTMNSAIFEYQDQVYIFGDVSMNSNEIYQLDMKKLEFKVVKVKSKSMPPPTYDFGYCIHKERFYFICGKRNPRGNLNNLWEFNFEKSEWKVLKTQKPIPSRIECSMLSFGDNLIVHGGFDGMTSRNDTIIIDIKGDEYEWHLPNYKDKIPCKRTCQAMEKVDDYILFYSGFNPSFSSETYYHDLWKLQFNPKALYEKRQQVTKPHQEFNLDYLQNALEIEKKGTYQTMKLDKCSMCKDLETFSGQFKVCGKCKSQKYCSVSCQTKDWSSHKLFCKK